jgi:hypothetical protein
VALHVKIDLENCYELDTSTDFCTNKFYTELKDDGPMLLGVLISNQVHHFLPDVYNLSFGPINQDNEIDDQVGITHADHSKTFSTIVFSALLFLSNNNDKYLGIDGSNNARAYLYYRTIQNNYDYLAQYFVIYGVNYYIRVLRKVKDEDSSHPVDPEDIEAIPRVIKKGEEIRSNKLYNYFIFKRKDEE